MLSYNYIKGQNRGKHFQDTVESRPLGNLSLYYIGGCKHRLEFWDESLLEVCRWQEILEETIEAAQGRDESSKQRG